MRSGLSCVEMPQATWFAGTVRRKTRRASNLGKRGVFGDRYDANTASITGAGLNNVDPTVERDPPPEPTPISFPSTKAHSTEAWSEKSPPPRLQPLFSRILKPSDISDSHLEAMNIQVQTDCSPEDMLPQAPDGTSYFPPLTPDQAITAASYSDATKADAATSKKRKEFDERLAELRVVNDAGYRVITRTTKPEMKPPRLAYFRKFWEGLESMAQYWDTSMDHYFDSTALPQDSGAEDEAEKGAKRQRLDSPQSKQVTVPILGLQTESSNGHGKGNDASHHLEESQKVASLTPIPSTDSQDEEDCAIMSTSVTPEPQSRMRYKGRRTATGRDMPDQFRNEAVRSFVEGAVWPFRCSVTAPRIMPIVQMNKLNLPVRQTAAVYRTSEERAKARAGIVAGPVFCIQVRPETDFHSPTLTKEQIETKARLDLMRELGGLLQCAQERVREGRTEVQPGEGKWWTTKPRWGGGPGGEVENQQGNTDSQTSDVIQMAEEMVGARARVTSKPRKKKTPAMLWKELKCGSKLWDPKIEYEAIGKDPEQDYDEVCFHRYSIVAVAFC